jgi:hypothetical protein
MPVNALSTPALDVKISSEEIVPSAGFAASIKFFEQLARISAGAVAVNINFIGFILKAFE